MYLSTLVDIPTVAPLRLPKKYSEKQTEKIESNLSNSELNYCVKGEIDCNQPTTAIDEPNKQKISLSSFSVSFYFWGNGKHDLHYYSSLFFPHVIIIINICNFPMQYLFCVWHGPALHGKSHEIDWNTVGIYYIE